MAADRGESLCWLLVLLLCVTLATGRLDLYVSRPSNISRDLQVACIATLPAGSVRAIDIYTDPAAVEGVFHNVTSTHVDKNIISAFKQATFTPNHCGDVHFQCMTDIQDASGIPDSEVAHAAFLQPPPGPPQISLHNASPLMAGDWLELTCRGDASSPDTEMTWELWREGNVTLPASQCPDCITRHAVQDNGCSRSLTSSLRFRLTARDCGLRVRCSLLSLSQSQTHMTSEFLVSLSEPAVSQPQLPASPATTAYPQDSSVDQNIVLYCVIAFLVLVVVVLVVWVSRLKRSGKHYELEKQPYPPPYLIPTPSTSSSEDSYGDKDHYAKVGDLEASYVPMMSLTKTASMATTEETSRKMFSDDFRPLPLSQTPPSPPPPPASPPQYLNRLCRQGLPQAPDNCYQNCEGVAV